MLLHQTQKIVAKSLNRFRVLNCGRRWGKTTLAVEEMKGFVLSAKKEEKICYIAPTYQQARDIAWEAIKREFRPIILKINESRLELEVMNKNGERVFIILRGWESIETIRGQHFKFLVLDEVASMRNFLIGWNEVLSPTLIDLRGHALFISTPKGFNHFYDLFNMEGKDENYKSFHFTSYDNPHIPLEELEREKSGKPDDTFAQEYLADFRKSDGLVYKEFSRDRHTFTDLPVKDFVKTFGGHDFGTTNPAASITIKKDRNAVYWVTDEHYRTGSTDAQQADYVAALHWDECYPDPESASGILELKRRGVNVREVIKNKDSIRNGINTVRELLLSNRLKISKSCESLLWELETYSYPKGRPNHNEDENPIKENDHACFTKDTKIEVPVGHKIIQAFTGVRDIYEFMGSKVTADHPYLTQRGLVKLDSLRYNDYICKWNKMLLTELPLDDTQNPRGLTLETTLYLLQINVSAIKLNASTGIYGKNTMVKYLKAFISTIKISIHLIILWIISNVYHLPNTIKDTITNAQSSIKNLLLLDKRKLVNGQKQKKEKNSVQNLVKRIVNTFQDTGSQGTAINVKKNTSQKQSLENSATIIAELKHLGKEEVFATTTTSGFFVAGGVVVSNCDALRYALSMDNALSARKYEHVPFRPVKRINQAR